MNRKKFLSSLLAAGAVLPVGEKRQVRKNRMQYIMPPYLLAGDTIGITCPGGNISIADIQPAVQQIQNWGFKIKIGETVGRKDFIFGGTDPERLNDFQQMLDDPALKAILCARGGYGCIRIIDGLEWSKFIRYPKWIIGFSDITVMHAHLDRNFGIASIHSKMCNSFPADWSLADPVQTESILSIRKALEGGRMTYPVAPVPSNRNGKAEGRLVGGNLKTLETLSGTRSDIKTEGKILFVEDTGEYLYSIDRMFRNLKRTGKLENLAGLIVGGFNIKPDDLGEEFGRTLQQIVQDTIQDSGYPVCFDFPVGHQKENYALKCGAMHRLFVQQEQVTLEEIT